MHVHMYSHAGMNIHSYMVAIRDILIIKYKVSNVRDQYEKTWHPTFYHISQCTLLVKTDWLHYDT